MKRATLIRHFVLYIRFSPLQRTPKSTGYSAMQSSYIMRSANHIDSRKYSQQIQNVLLKSPVLPLLPTLCKRIALLTELTHGTWQMIDLRTSWCINILAYWYTLPTGNTGIAIQLFSHCSFLSPAYFSIIVTRMASTVLWNVTFKVLCNLIFAALYSILRVSLIYRESAAFPPIPRWFTSRDSLWTNS